MTALDEEAVERIDRASVRNSRADVAGDVNEAGAFS
jgi:hypothetical protein